MLFITCYAYQLFYLAYMLVKKPARAPMASRKHRFGVVICARNEENVIGQLLSSVKAQDYPQELLEMFVVADNCTDATAAVAREAGARVLERSDTEHIGKGYALDFLFKRLLAEGTPCEGFLVLDADNVLAPDYITQMNNVFDQGFRIITSYRNSKNYNTNWISAGYSLRNKRYGLYGAHGHHPQKQRLEASSAYGGYRVYKRQHNSRRTGGLFRGLNAL